MPEQPEDASASVRFSDLVRASEESWERVRTLREVLFTAPAVQYAAEGMVLELDGCGVTAYPPSATEAAAVIGMDLPQRRPQQDLAREQEVAPVPGECAPWEHWHYDAYGSMVAHCPAGVPGTAQRFGLRARGYVPCPQCGAWYLLDEGHVHPVEDFYTALGRVGQTREALAMTKDPETLQDALAVIERLKGEVAKLQASWREEQRRAQKNAADAARTADVLETLREVLLLFVPEGGSGFARSVNVSLDDLNGWHAFAREGRITRT